MLYSVTSEEAAQHFVLREGDEELHCRLVACIEGLWRGTVCSVRRCSNCQFGFSDPYIAGDANFYNLAHDRTTYPSDKWEYRRTLNALEGRDFRGKKVLEVGAGIGLFLDKIADKRVFRRDVTALELNDRSIDVLRGKGYSVVQADLRTAKLNPGFHAIFLFQVVEHMDHLDLLFSRLSELVAAGGRIFIAVPNGCRIDFQESSGGLLDMPPNHIGRWSLPAFETVTAAHKLKISAFEVEPFSIPAFVKRDVVYSYLRKSQKSSTVWNWSRSKGATRTGKLLGAAFAMFAAPSRIPVWLRAAGRTDLGAVIWVELTTNNDGGRERGLASGEASGSAGPTVGVLHFRESIQKTPSVSRPKHHAEEKLDGRI